GRRFCLSRALAGRQQQRPAAQVIVAVVHLAGAPETKKLGAAHPVAPLVLGDRRAKVRAGVGGQRSGRPSVAAAKRGGFLSAGSPPCAWACTDLMPRACVSATGQMTSSPCRPLAPAPQPQRQRTLDAGSGRCGAVVRRGGSSRSPPANA